MVPRFSSIGPSLSCWLLSFGTFLCAAYFLIYATFHDPLYHSCYYPSTRSPKSPPSPACYKQISNFDGSIADCTSVLDFDPQNVKALIRRAQAFEGVERYRMALQDIKQVLQMPYNQVGKVNFDLCNGMQHRLQRTVTQLKKMDSS
jgi:hypothetical protein